MDLEQVHLTLASVLGLLGVLAGGVATVVSWLGRSAWEQKEKNLEMRLEGMTAATRLAREAAQKADDERVRVERELTARIHVLEIAREQLGGQVKWLEATISENRQTLVSKEYLDGKFGALQVATFNQDKTLAKQDEELKAIRTELQRKVSVGNMPAVRGEPPFDSRKR